MSRKKTILIQTNSPKMHTGLAENGRALAKYLFNTGKYNLIYYCTQAHQHDPSLQCMPWKAYGSIPGDMAIQQQMNQNQGLARDIAYGSYFIDQIIKENKVDILWESDDAWSTPNHAYMDKPWWNKINTVLHKTIDSLPVLDQAVDQASKTKNYFTWTKFGNKEFHSKGYKHVKTIYGAMDTNIYSPIPKEQKLHLRKMFGIDPNTTIIGFVFRNQLRKMAPTLLKAFAEFKKKTPDANIKLHLHTSVSEMGAGWNLPKLIEYYGIKKEDVLFTYVCKVCGKWLVAPYQGEDINCPICKAEKSMITPNIAIGVPHEEMKLVYGLWDAGINVHTSGGLEINCCNTLLCGLPLAVTNYSSGEDFCEQPFVFPLAYESTYEPGTNFIKAATSIKSIVGFMEQIYRMPESERVEIGRKGREWAVKTFSIETIGKQWEELFDSLPLIDWDTIDLNPPKANPSYELPANSRDLPNDEFVKLLYRNILNREPDEGGFNTWMTQLNNKVPREEIVGYFRKVANEEVQKNTKTDIWDIIDKDRPNSRLLFVVKESAGDTYICTALLEGIKENYPNHDIYWMGEQKYHEILEGCPLIHKILPYIPQLDNEMAAIGCGQEKGLFDVYLCPTVLTQHKLSYLSNNNPKLI
jgi:glycosyltransferase involved in cell wall biosynthesis